MYSNKYIRTALNQQDSNLIKKFLEKYLELLHKHLSNYADSDTVAEFKKQIENKKIDTHLFRHHCNKIIAKTDPEKNTITSEECNDYRQIMEIHTYFFYDLIRKYPGEFVDLDSILNVYLHSLVDKPYTSNASTTFFNQEKNFNSDHDITNQKPKKIKILFCDPFSKKGIIQGELSSLTDKTCMINEKSFNLEIKNYNEKMNKRIKERGEAHHIFILDCTKMNSFIAMEKKLHTTINDYQLRYKAYTTPAIILLHNTNEKTGENDFANKLKEFAQNVGVNYIQEINMAMEESPSLAENLVAYKYVAPLLEALGKFKFISDNKNSITPATKIYYPTEKSIENARGTAEMMIQKIGTLIKLHAENCIEQFIDYAIESIKIIDKSLNAHFPQFEVKCEDYNQLSFYKYWNEPLRLNEVLSEFKEAIFKACNFHTHFKDDVRQKFQKPESNDEQKGCSIF